MTEIDLTVIISTRDRARWLEKTLEQLSLQEVGPIRWEVFVVNNGSRDDTGDVLKRMSAKLPLFHFFEPEPGKSRACNRAIETAHGELLLFTDDDIVPSRRWVAEAVASGRRWTSDSVFCGPIVPLYPDGFPQAFRDHPIESFAYAKFMPLILEEAPLPKGVYPFGGNFAVRRSTLGNGTRFSTAIGPCGEQYPMGEDLEILRQLVGQGHRIIFNPAAAVAHVIESPQLRASWLLARAVRFGRGLTHLSSQNSGSPPLTPGVGSGAIKGVQSVGYIALQLALRSMIEIAALLAMGTGVVSEQIRIWLRRKPNP